MDDMPVKNGSFQLNEQLDVLRESGSFTDVVLICGESKKEILAHKVILSGASHYFQVMFSPNWEENQSGRVELPTVGAEEMEVILPYLYTGKLKCVEDESLLKKVLSASHLLQINPLFECCYKRLCAGLSSASFLEIYNLADLYGDEGMLKQVITFLPPRFVRVAQSDEFLKLSGQQVKKMVQLLDPIDPPMDSLLKGLIRWVLGQDEGENRLDTLREIISTLDLQLITSELLTELLRNQTIRKNCNILVLLTAEATARMLTSADLSENIHDSKFLVFGKNQDEQQIYRMYDVMRHQWSTRKVVPFQLQRGMTLVWCNGHVYIAGGDVPSSKIVQYNPTTNTIVSVGKLAVPVSYPFLGVLHQFIYIATSTSSSKVVQRYNPVTEVCETVAQLHNSHTSLPQVFTFRDCLYVLGSAPSQNSIERYDPASNTWSVVTYIPGEIDNCNAAICNNKLFVVPSRASTQFHIHDFSTEKWETKGFQRGPHSICGLKSVMLKGKSVLLALDNHLVVHLYDTESDQWIRKSRSNIKQACPGHTLLL